MHKGKKKAYMQLKLQELEELKHKMDLENSIGNLIIVGKTSCQDLICVGKRMVI